MILVVVIVVNGEQWALAWAALSMNVRELPGFRIAD